jgi:LPXTG-site transpeptidase (sortase) family protein
MYRKRTSFIGAIVSLAVVSCVSVLIVGAVVIWIAAREGTSAVDIVSGLLQGQQSARPVLLDSTPWPTLTPRPSPTPLSAAAVTAQEFITEAIPLPAPTEPFLEAAPLPQANPPTPAAVAAVVPQAEVVVESPIRPGSPLPERPATRLVIPVMEVDVPVVLAPIVNQTWQVDHLGTEFVGHLEGTASPGEPSNLVLAGHVTVAHNVYGPFAGLGKLQPGDSILVYDGDQPYTYVVDYRKLVERTSVDVAYPTDTGRITLITCSDWSEELGAYQQRLIVVGHLAAQ